MTETDNRKRAVILSVGGADGAYDVGVLKALFSRQSAEARPDTLDPDGKPETLGRELFAPTSCGGALGILDSHRDRIQNLIDRGLANASHHCNRSERVIPRKPRIAGADCRRPLQFND